VLSQVGVGPDAGSREAYSRALVERQGNLKYQKEMINKNPKTKIKLKRKIEKIWTIGTSLRESRLTTKSLFAEERTQEWIQII